MILSFRVKKNNNHYTVKYTILFVTRMIRTACHDIYVLVKSSFLYPAPSYHLARALNVDTNWIYVSDFAHDGYIY